MSNLHRVLTALIFLAGLAWCLSSTATTQSGHADGTGLPGAKIQSDDGQPLAARYHLRGRTKGFFGRTVV
ncbi:MAG: hypothetical protein HQ567_31125 [Candidatus Nealsonbacteria bacterium]|nr:hypothetical protein [Candidatus Nealsonbacteria bacterium]